MRIEIEPKYGEWEEICRRPADANPVVRERVEKIIARVKEGGDEALRAIAAEIDGFTPASFEITPEELEEASRQVSDEVKEAVRNAARNIEAFHKAQLPKTIEVETQKGVRCIQKPVPIQKVGLYIPGGTAPLFSTVLMLAIPAKLAGCSEIILCTPSNKQGQVAPAVLYAAHYCGVTKIFRIGGSQAIAAMAFGTESVPKVNKIFGPGNQYVTTAKQILGGSMTAIDMPAGPSEVMVIIDSTSDPAYAAADLLSQAEHGLDSQVMLVSDSGAAAEAVAAEVDRQVELLGRADLAKGALSKSHAVVFKDIDNIIAFANLYAPEHLIVSTAEPWRIVDRITDAGSVFVGKYTPESAGDYASGTNHTLPTCGWAHSHSGVNIDSYMRKMTIQEISREGLQDLAGTIITMAEAEGLQAHANAAAIRIK